MKWQIWDNMGVIRMGTEDVPLPTKEAAEYWISLYTEEEMRQHPEWFPMFVVGVPDDEGTR